MLVTTGKQLIYHDLLVIYLSDVTQTRYLLQRSLFYFVTELMQFQFTVGLDCSVDVMMSKVGVSIRDLHWNVLSSSVAPIRNRSVQSPERAFVWWWGCSYRKSQLTSEKRRREEQVREWMFLKKTRAIETSAVRKQLCVSTAVSLCCRWS